MPLDRRTFLVGFVGAMGARSLFAIKQSGLDAFGGETLPCVSEVKATPSVSARTAYKPGAPMRRSIAAAGEKGVPLLLTGIVAGLACGPISGATIEFWQPDAAGAYDTTGFNLRGRQVTDAGGRYRLTTIVPGGSATRAPSIGIHVVVNNKAELWTAMFFPGQPGNSRDPGFKEELLVKLGATDAARTGTFDIRLDL